MDHRPCFVALTFLALLSMRGLRGAWPDPLDPAHLDRKGVVVERVRFQDRDASRVMSADGPLGDGGIAIVKDTDFANGSILVDLAGQVREGANPTARGFIGVAFRVQDDGGKYECFYLRPTNGRAEEQLRRNHSTQYISHPEYPWERLRSEHPGEYESYVDLVPGAWMSLRIDVDGTDARLFVNTSEQPCLVVHDLKLGTVHGPVALWIGSGTEAYFANLRIVPADVPSSGK